MGHQGELVSYDAPNSGWIIAQDFIGRYRWLCEFINRQCLLAIVLMSTR